ncbi:chromo domain-containing protein [Bosea sp. (in: a-proteobacteria)]|uniref:chromo domain-containing protein n=1 Tax=Bosea sp. (in: a-proteobacteria) TaxID=1871050 RepID=UPI004033478B
MEYLVKWTGYDDTYNTWEPEANLAGAPQILSRYKAVHNLPCTHDKQGPVAIGPTIAHWKEE